MAKKKNVNVEVEVTTSVEELENKEVNTVEGGNLVEVAEGTAVAESGMGKVEEISGNEETAAVESETGEGSVASDETATAVEGLQAKARRQNGSGSIYELTGGKGWGFCIQLHGGNKELKAKYGNKLRFLQTAKTYDEILVKLEAAMANKDELLRQKLVKLGHEFIE